MHNIEAKELIEEFISDLKFELRKENANQGAVTNFATVITAVKKLSAIPTLYSYAEPILNHEVVRGNEGAMDISIAKPAFTYLADYLIRLKISAEIFEEMILKEENLPENSLLIKLPELKTFEDLSKISNDFKIALEVPLHDSNEDLRIEKAEEGSIWITIITTVGGAALISKIVYAGIQYAKLSAQLKWHNEQSRTIGLKNDLIETILEHQKKYLTQLAAEETKNIFSPETDPETFNRFKVSVEMMGDLIERGAELKPGLISDEKVNDSFPKFKDVNLLVDVMKKITNDPT